MSAPPTLIFLQNCNNKTSRKPRQLVVFSWSGNTVSFWIFWIWHLINIHVSPNRWRNRSLLLSIFQHDRLVHNRTFWYSDWLHRSRFNLTCKYDFLKISAIIMWIKYHNSFIFILSQQRVYLMVCSWSRTYKVYSHIKLSSSSRIAYLYYVNFPSRDVVDLQRSVLARNWVM